MLCSPACCKHVVLFHRTAENLLPTRYGNGINSILEDFQEIQGTQNPSANPRTAGSSSQQIIVQASHVCAVILLPPSPLEMLSVPSCHGNSYMAVDLFASTASTAGDSQVSIWPMHKMLRFEVIVFHLYFCLPLIQTQKVLIASMQFVC